MEDGTKEIQMSMPALRIAIMNRQYGNTIGGVERASIRLANEMIARGHNVHIISLDTQTADMPFELDRAAIWHKISETDAKKKAPLKERMARFVRIHKILKRHRIDVAMGFQDGAYLSLRIGAIFTGVPIVAAERNSPTRFDYMKSKYARYIAFNSFRFARRITLQCPSYVPKYPLYLQNKISVIPNSVDVPALASVRDYHGTKEILFVGRLDYQKNVGTMISAFSKISEHFPEWRLRIVGGGPQEPALKKQAQDYGLHDRIVFEGMQKNVFSYYTSSHIFCLPSLWEGFPNALAEAMAHALPCVGYRACSGVCDLIEDGVSGYLAEGPVIESDALAECLSRLMQSPQSMQKMGAAAYEQMKSYKPEKIYGLWEDLFFKLAK